MRVSVVKAKAELSALMSEVSNGGQPVVIEKRGKPVAALVSMKDLERLGHAIDPNPRGLLSLVGLSAEAGLEDWEVDEMIADIYKGRGYVYGEPPDSEEE